MRYHDRDDLLLIKLPENCHTAVTLTRNRFAAAPVQLVRKHLAVQQPRYLLINAGQANAGTGEQGIKNAIDCCQYLAAKAHTGQQAILPFSTGVIGEQLPMDKIQSGIDVAFENLGSANWEQAAAAILTTDTCSKHSRETFTINGDPCHIIGIAKGSGMIRPDMATMLAFIITDACIPDNLLQRALTRAVDQSFHCITIDGDTSTNDACTVSATGQGDVKIDHDDMLFDAFCEKLTLVCQQLAQAIVQDGEGATKLVRIHVSGCRSISECRTIGFTVAHSPLVKTALFGQDPNWGRILAAVGRAPVEDFDLAKVDISLDDIAIVHRGEPAEEYLEEDGIRIMQRDSITIGINLNAGDHEAEILTCDLSHDYVRINADYRS